METEYLDEEQVIALYNKVRRGKRTWPRGIGTPPAALQYAVTVFDYWIHNVMGWKGWPDARGKVTPALLEEHRLADLVESVFVPEFGDDWLDFEVVLNESMRLSEDESWAPDVADRQERVEAASSTRSRSSSDRRSSNPSCCRPITVFATTCCACGARSRRRRPSTTRPSASRPNAFGHSCAWSAAAAARPRRLGPSYIPTTSDAPRRASSGARRMPTAGACGT